MSVFLLSPALFLAAGCVEPELPTGAWSPGDVHVHSSLGSNDTDGLGTPDALGPAMEAAGLEWVVLTDHSNSAGSMHCEDVEDCPNLGPEIVEANWPDGVYAGSEISLIHDLDQTLVANGHIGCVAEDGASFPGLDHFTDRPAGTLEGADAVRECHDAGGWAIVNHPYAAAGWIAYDFTSETFEALEVYNGGARFDAWDHQTLTAWEQRVKDGRNVVPVGGSDCHRWGVEAPGDGLLNPALGWPTTWVHVREGETPIDAMMAGRVVIAEPGTELSVTAFNKVGVIGPGESIRGPVTIRIEASTQEADRIVELREVGGDRVVSRPLTSEKLVFERDVGDGIFYVRVWPADLDPNLDEGGVAMTAALTIEEAL